MKATLPLPPSVWRKNKQARDQWKERVKDVLTRDLRKPPGPVEIVLDFFAPFLRADGTPNPLMADTKNLVFVTEDYVAECLGYNDRWNFRLVATRHHSEREYCTVELRPWRA